MVRLSCADFALRGIGWGVGITSASADAAKPKLTLGFEYAGWIPVTVARQPMARQAGKAGASMSETRPDWVAGYAVDAG